MSRQYLGEKDVTNQFSHVPKEEFAMIFIEMYGQIDGAHHKAWVFDQVARILMGSPVTVREASWSDGTKEKRYTVGECDNYNKWVHSMIYEGAEEPQYNYDQGSPP